MWEIDGRRLWNSLTELARIGGTARGGVRRLALTEADRRGRERFAQWCRAAGMAVRVDAIGNLFARRAGADDPQPAVLVGSHLDTQPEGGRFDGAYGVLAGLELVRTLNDRGIVTGKPIEIVSWTNEEGARFTPAMLGSAVFTGALPLDAALAARVADTAPQSRLAFDARRANVAAAFAVARAVAGLHVGVDHDEITAGATLDALARTLKEAGARRVTNFVALRTAKD